MTVVTRFAPSPTGFLHIGSARTALFNWLFSRHWGGKFFLRIEDTDRVRSTVEAEAAILEGLKWLGLQWDDEPVLQFSRAGRHQEVAYALLEKGAAYKCYTTPQELEEKRRKAKLEGQTYLHDGFWRDRSPAEAPAGVAPVIRLKAFSEGETVIEDLVQGVIKIQNAQLDDMVLLRADGTPTYMLSVVVDDHDMGISHVIRGDDHLTNTFRQLQIYYAMGWRAPQFAHIPLIHGADGAKLSKRHGALGVDAYQKMGFLPEALKNYLLRLGWGYGDTEIISEKEAIHLFSLENVGKSPARFDWAKLTALNAHYIREKSNEELLTFLKVLFREAGTSLSEVASQRILAGLTGLKQRAKTLLELQENALIYSDDFSPVYQEEAQMLVSKPESQEILKAYLVVLEKEKGWSEEILENISRAFAHSLGLKLGQLAQPLRAVLTGRTVSPPVFEIMVVLGRDMTLERLRRGLEG